MKIITFSYQYDLQEINYQMNYKNFMMVKIILYINNSFRGDLDVVRRADEEKQGDLTKRTDGKDIINSQQKGRKQIPMDPIGSAFSLLS
jgi:hypothetical protein